MPDSNEPSLRPLPSQSPLFHALNVGRYDRQSQIQEFEAQYNCQLVVLIDALFPQSITPFEELIYDSKPDKDLYLMIASPGGDGDTAIRLVRMAQARCRELIVVVPDQAKSAATLLALGAHHIMMGPTSDLGPIDPQFLLNGGLVSAKDMIAAVEEATARVQAAPETYPIHAALLSDVTALMVQQARSAILRTADQLEEALTSNSDRTKKTVATLKAKLKKPLIDAPKSHSALIGLSEAARLELPVIEADPSSHQWQSLWRLWAKYYALGSGVSIYEGRRVSHISPFVWEA